MVRDIESLIEFLYLKSINSPLNFDRILVNPKLGDSLVGKICIINTIYGLPDLELADGVINRFQDPYINSPNPYIRFTNILSDDLHVHTENNLFYFGLVPESLITEGNCFDYIEKQRLLLIQ